jgi:hypothetical protein
MTIAAEPVRTLHPVSQKVADILLSPDRKSFWLSRLGEEARLLGLIVRVTATGATA